LNILFVSNLYPPNTVGGYERLCYKVAEALNERGHAISVLTSSYGGRHESYPGQDIDRSLKLLATEGNIYLPFACSPDELALHNSRNKKLLKEKVAALRPDVVFAWNLFFLDRSLLEALQELESPAVFFLTDNWLISMLNNLFLQNYFGGMLDGHGSLRGRLRFLLARLKASLQSKEVTIQARGIFASKFIQELYFAAGLRFKDSTVIYNGVEFLHPSDSQPVNRANLLEQGKLKLLFAGRIVEIKGVHTCIEALPAIRQALPDLEVSLNIVGDNQDETYFKRLKQIAERHRVGDHISYLQPVSEGRLFDLFQRYDVYVFPSLYEPFSLTLILALSAGIPTIASDAGGNPEIVYDGQTGLLFPKGNVKRLADAVSSFARDPGLRKSVSDRARVEAANFGLSAMVDRIEANLKSVK
jgi:glycogen synthase